MTSNEAVEEIKTYNFLTDETKFNVKKHDDVEILQIISKGKQCLTLSENLVAHWTPRIISVFEDNIVHIILIRYM